MRILVAYDGSPSADAAVREVIDRPWPPGSEIRLVTVVQPPISMVSVAAVELYGPLYEKMRATLREEAYKKLQTVLRGLQSRPELKASYDLREGDIRQCLLDAIHEWKADLVMAGSRGAGGVSRLFLGSVSHSLVTHAPCNVEIVKVAVAA